jgi:hypothetical protein
MVIMFLTGVYHPKSPLSNEFPLVKRRNDAAVLAGFPLDDSGLPIHMDIICNTDEYVLKCMLSYIRIFNNPDFETSIIMRNELDVLHEKLTMLNAKIASTKDDSLNSKLQEDERKLIYQNIKVATDNLKSYELSALQQDNSRMLVMSFYDDLEVDTTGLAPEPIAINLKEGKKPLGKFNAWERRKVAKA